MSAAVTQLRRPPRHLRDVDMQRALGAAHADEVIASIRAGDASGCAWLRALEISTKHGRASVVLATFVARLAQRAAAVASE